MVGGDDGRGRRETTRKYRERRKCWVAIRRQLPGKRPYFHGISRLAVAPPFNKAPLIDNTSNRRNRRDWVASAMDAGKGCRSLQCRAWCRRRRRTGWFRTAAPLAACQTQPGNKPAATSNTHTNSQSSTPRVRAALWSVAGDTSTRGDSVKCSRVASRVDTRRAAPMR
jgi:hypothetical protein